MANWFGITSAININYGIFNNNDRFNQTIESISSIRQKCPDSKIVLLESSPYGLEMYQKNHLEALCDKVIMFDKDPMIRWMHARYTIQQIKSPSELYIMEQFLHKVPMNENDRVFKISGRYKLSDKFDIAIHTSEKAIFGPNFEACNYYDDATGEIYQKFTDRQYRTRLYSFPGKMIPEMKDKYYNMINFFWNMYNGKFKDRKRRFSDVEHVMYKFMDHDKVLEVRIVGLIGIFANRNELIDE
jgi:hypothetical protein